MTGEIVPFSLSKQATDITRFENFAVPTRRMTATEQATYDKLAYDWARLDAMGQKLAYAAILTSELQDFFIDLFAKGITVARDKLHEFTDPQDREMFREYALGMMRLTAQAHASFRDVTARNMRDILQEDFPEPRPDNIFRRLLASRKGRSA